MTQAAVRAQIDRIERDMEAEWGPRAKQQIACLQEELMADREWQVTPRWKKDFRIFIERVVAALSAAHR